MGKMKVYELAKELNMSNTEMIDWLKKENIDVKSHLSTLEEADVERVRKNFKKRDVKEEKKSTDSKNQVYIVRRNVKVINSNEEKKEEPEKEALGKNYENKAKNFNKNNNPYKKGNDRKVRFPNNRTANIVITRNGKPIENKNEIKPEPEVKVEEIVKKESSKEKVMEDVKSEEKIVRNNKDEMKKQNYNPQSNPNENKFNKNVKKEGNFVNNKNRNNTGKNNSSNTDNRYNKNNNFNRNNANNRQNNNYRQNGYNRNDNTNYQVNKFIKQSEKLPVESKETREYSNVNIDKKKYNEKVTTDQRKEKLDKNKLRERHSRVSTSKLRGMEIDTSTGLLDLYERDSDLAKKSYSKKKAKAKQEIKQTKIIPMTKVKLPETMTVKEFAEAIKKQASEVIKKLLDLGILATVNKDIDFDTAYLVASEFGITAEKEVKVTEEDILFDDSEDEEDDLVPRPPIVVVMGHVDHGKTSLLDRLRSTNVVEGEAGGITQHIGAYKVTVHDREVCFLDTPGHEAFTAMRARGAQVTDIAVIIIAADDGIKPQTIEAIDHAKAAGVSIIVAINKIDKPTANVERVKQQLLEVGVVPEEWGGDTICVPISAATGEGIDNLLEMILLVADMKNLRASLKKQAKGTVLEARLDKTKGTIVSMLVQRGELNVGDTIIVDDMVAKIRAMKDDKGRKVKSAGPSTPVEVLGLSHVPQTGDLFYEVENEKVAKHLIEKRKANIRAKMIKQGNKITLDDLFGQIKEGKIKDLNVIIKADVQGSVEALKESLEKLSNEEVRVRVLHASTGGIKESDVTLASVSNAIIIGFNVRPESLAAEQAKKEKVDLRLYSVIYDAINDVETALKGMMPKKYKEVMHGVAEVRKIFKITGVGIVAGCYVQSGKMIRGAMVRLVRDSIVLLEKKIDSLKREKDDVKEVAEGYECGIKLEEHSDIKEGDIFECFTMEEEK